MLAAALPSFSIGAVSARFENILLSVCTVVECLLDSSFALLFRLSAFGENSNVLPNTPANFVLGLFHVYILQAILKVNQLEVSDNNLRLQLCKVYFSLLLLQHLLDKELYC